MIKRVATLFVVTAGLIAGSYATDSRVEVMGRSQYPWFYRDEVTVFRNPADMSLYGNMLYGSFGETQHMSGIGAANNYITESELDLNPFFGGMVSIGGDDDGTGALTIGAFVNRHDPMIDMIMAGGAGLLDPIGKFDVMVAYNLGGGLALGLGYYGAFNSVVNDGDIQQQTALHQINAGMNMAMNENLDLEFGVNFGFVNSQTGPADAQKVHDGDMFLRGDFRAFFGMDALNGAFVPQASLLYTDLAGISGIALDAGLGVNMNIDRGFFFGGLQAVYRNVDRGDGTDDYSELGTRLSFGIERNIVWDWFMIRVGGQKELIRVTDGDVSTWDENPIADGTSGDLVGLGFGVNIDNRLRVDVTVSEQLPYTFTNIISGNMNRLFHRVSATFRF